MTKKISDDELVEIAGGVDGPIIDLDEQQQQNDTPDIGRNPNESGGVGGLDPDPEGGGGGIDELG